MRVVVKGGGCGEWGDGGWACIWYVRFEDGFWRGFMRL